jgi:hypothetical protein
MSPGYVYIDAYTNTGSVDPSVAAWLDSWDNSTNPVKGYLTFHLGSDQTVYLKFAVVAVANGSGLGGANWRIITVNYVDGSDTFLDNQEVVVSFTPFGDTGATGISGYTGVQGVAGQTGVQGATGISITSIAQNAQTEAYTLVGSDANKHISITSGGVTVPASVFSVGERVYIYNNSSSDQTITQGANVTLRLAGTASTGNRTLSQYGFCTLLCVAGGSTPTFVIYGGGGLS